MSIVIRARAIEVELLDEDLAHAAHVGVRRRVDSLHKPGRYGAEDSGPHMWTQDIEAAAAELAVALYLDLPWNGEQPLAPVDVGRNIQVRHTQRSGGCLIVHGTERDQDIFVLVTGDMGRYKLRGWLEGAACKQQRYLFTPPSGRTAYFVPQDQLAPMPELRVP